MHSQKNETIWNELRIKKMCIPSKGSYIPTVNKSFVADLENLYVDSQIFNHKIICFPRA